MPNELLTIQFEELASLAALSQPNGFGGAVSWTPKRLILLHIAALCSASQVRKKLKKI